MPRRLFALVIKELLAVWRDRKSRFVLVVPPLLQLAVFSYAATYDVTNITLAVLNQDAGHHGSELVARFEGAPAFSRLLAVATERDLAEAIESRRAMAAIHLPQRFSADLLAGRPASLRIVLDGRRSNTAQIIHGYAAAIVSDFNATWAAAAGRPAPPAALVTRAWFNPNLQSLWIVVPGLVAVLTEVVTLVVTALSVARERELGTFEQLLVTPLRPWEIMAGKTVPAMLIGLVEGTVIVLAAQLWFGVPFTGSLVLLYGGLVVFMASIIGIGLFISALSATQQQAILGAFLFLVPAIILSGFATPVENMPAWLQAVTQGNPLRHFLVVLNGVFLKDMPAELVWRGVWPMIVIAAVTLTAATALFRRRLY